MYYRIRDSRGQILPGASVAMSAGPEAGDRGEGIEDTRFVNSCGCYRRIGGPLCKRLLQEAKRRRVPLYLGTARDYLVTQGVPCDLLDEFDPQGDTIG